MLFHFLSFSALLDYCRPGIFKDWQKLNPHNGYAYICMFIKYIKSS